MVPHGALWNVNIERMVLLFRYFDDLEPDDSNKAGLRRISSVTSVS